MKRSHSAGYGAAAEEDEICGQGGVIHPLDLTVVCILLAGFVGFGIYQARFNRSAEDYFLGSGKIPWPIAMLSIVATETSVLTFVSVPGLAYRGDWFFLQLALGYIAGRIAVSIFLLPRYFESGVTSIYEVIGQRFGPGIQKTASAMFLVTRVLADSVRFLATAVVVQVIFGWPLPSAVLVIGGVTLLYTLLGGIKAVVWVDSFQFVIYLLGAALCIGGILYAIEQPLFETVDQLAALDKIKIFHFEKDFFHDPWSAVSAIIGGMLLSFASHGVDHMMVQRVLACRGLSSARKAMIGSGVFAFVQFMIFLFAGSLIYLFFSGAEIEKDREFTTFMTAFLPAGVKGFLLAGVLCAAMSTLSSSINSLASSTAVDWLKKKASLKTSRVITLFWGGVLITIAMLLDESESAVVEIGLEIASFTYGGMLGLFLLSKTKRAFHPASLITGLVSSLGFVLVLRQCGIAWTWFVAAGAAAFMIAAVGLDSAWKRKK